MDRQDWGRRITYELVYPGILGSMIFDLRDPLRGFTVATSGVWFIVFAYLADFVHLKTHLGESRKIWWPDLAIAAGFCLAAFFLTTVDDENKVGKLSDWTVANKCLWSQLLLLVTYAGVTAVDIYTFYPNRVGACFALLAAIVSLAGLVVLLCNEQISDWLERKSDEVAVLVAVGFTILSTVFYLIHVWQFSRYAPPAPAN